MMSDATQLSGSTEVLPAEVHLWIARVDACFALAPPETWLAALQPEDRTHCLRAQVDSVRRERIVSRALIRQGLSHFGGRPASSWCFTENQFGRPQAIDAEGLTFNVSHSRGLVVSAFARDREVGIDTESVLRAVPARVELGRFLSPRETLQLFEAPEVDFARTFFRFWTLKEAYAKARGIGISIGFDKFSVDLGEELGVELGVEPRTDLGVDPGTNFRTEDLGATESAAGVRAIEMGKNKETHPRLLDDRTSSSWHLREISVPPHHLVGLVVEQIAPPEELVVHVRTIIPL